MTEKLYLKDSHMKSFKATVISCIKGEKGYEVVLDRTAFFPEGGGQFADTGMIEQVKVLDVQEQAGQIVHYLEDEVLAGTEVEGKIDWEQRFVRMQQHTGEHIVTGLIHKRFGYQNVGFHLGNEVCTLDMNGPITPDELTEIEDLANQAVFQNIKVESLFPTKEELEQLEYRSKKELDGEIQIIHIPGYDMCACCAPHVSYTGEIGLIKLIQMQNYKGGVRITMLCGARALSDYKKKEAAVKNIMHMLSAKEENVSDAVEHLKEEINEIKLQLQNKNREILAYKAEKVEEGQEAVCLFEEDLDGNALREYMNLVLSRNTGICAVMLKTSEGYRYVIGSKTTDVRAIGKCLNEAFQGRGGGKPEMVQGSLKGEEDQIRALFLQIVRE